jgi:hypothetical protein
MTPLPDGEKLSSLEERLAKLEASLREKAIDERIENLEYQADESSDADSDGSEQHSVEGEGQKALFLALANFLNSGALKDAFTAVGDLIKQHSESKLKEAEAQAKEAGAQREFAWKANRMGLLFSALVFILLCGLLWLDKITKELAAGLIGSLIGYWYGHQKDK